MHEKDNYLKTAELSTEQNCNMIDGVPNNTPIPPTSPELDAKPLDKVKEPKERRKVMASKPIPYLLRYIIELADLTVTCELHLQHLSLCIVPCGSDHRISQYVPSHCLLFSLSVSAFVIPDRNVLYYNAFSYIFSLKEFPLYTFT